MYPSHLSRYNVLLYRKIAANGEGEGYFSKLLYECMCVRELPIPNASKSIVFFVLGVSDWTGEVFLYENAMEF